MITDETITDEQIRELRVEAVTAWNFEIHRACKTALGERFWWGEVPSEAARRRARARCAEILNARAKESK